MEIVLSVAGTIILLLLGVVGFLLRMLLSNLEKWKNEIASKIDGLRNEYHAREVQVTKDIAALDKRLSLLEQREQLAEE